MLKTFYFYWLDGKKNIATAKNVAGALNKLGYSQGALAALDCYSNTDDYQWDAINKVWVKKEDTAVPNSNDTHTA